ncbi:MAG: nucleotidyltransferase family protein [Thermodesulfobacteriota bacterium]
MIPRVGALVLAAESSPKVDGFAPLLPIRGSTALGLAVRALRRAGVDDMVVLAGRDALEVHAEAARLGLGCVSGLAGAGGLPRVRAALDALPDGLDGVVFMPADRPLVRPATIRALAESLGGRPVVRPVFRGERGKPVLAAAQALSSIGSWSAASGLEGALEALEALHGAEEVPVADSNILLGIGTGEDYREAMRRVRRMERPSPEEARALLEMRGMDARGMEHAGTVARVALALARALSDARGWPLDMEFVQASALMLELGAGRGSGAVRAGRALESAGFPEAARIVRTGGDASLDPASPITEREVAVLAGRLVHCGGLVPLGRRYREKLERHGRDPAAREALAARRDAALALQARLEAEAGMTVREIMAVEGLFMPRDQAGD